MSDVGSNSLLSAFVELRAKAAANFESEARDSLLPGLGRIAQDAAGVFAATKVFDIGREGIDRLGELQKTAVQTAVVLRSTGGAAGVSAAGVDELASSLSKMSGVDHEAIASAENLILQMTNVRNSVGAGHDIFDRATKDSLDLSVAMGTDVKSAASTLGLALEDPVAGMAKLRRAHVVLTEEQKAAVKQFVAVGDVASAQAVILDQVEKQVGGSAKAYGQTLPGELAKAQTAMKDAKAAMVGGLAPALEAGAGLATNLATHFSELPRPLQEVGGGIVLVGGGLAALVRPAADAARLITTLKDAHAAAALAAAAQATTDEGLAVAEGEAAAASGALTAALGPIGLIAAAAGAVFAIGSLIQGDHDVKKATVDYTTALQDQTGVLDENVDKVSAHALAQNDAARTAHDAGLSYGAMFDAIRNGGPELDRFTGALKSSGGDTVVATDYLRRYGAETNTFGQHLLDLVGTGKLSVDQVTALAEAVAGLSDKYRADKGAADATKEGLDSVAAAADGTAVSTKDLATAVKDLGTAYQAVVDGTLSSFQAELALSDAQIASRKAIDDLTKARKEGKLSNDEGTKATNAAFQAILQEAKANEALALSTATGASETEKAAISQKALIDELYKVASTLAPGSDLQNQIESYITKLQGTPATVATTYQLDTTAAVQALIDLQRQLAGIAVGAAGNVDISFQGDKGPTRARAAGGPVSAGEVFMGAEAGTEALLLNQGPGLYRSPGAGTVIPAAQTAQLLHRDSGAVHNHYNNVTVVAQAEPAERAVRRELDRLTVLAGR